jgi:hypothetical protein
MPKVPFTAFFNGPLAVYTSPTAQLDPITGGIYLGTDFIEGNYADVDNDDAAQWNSQYGTQLRGGRYRICRVATNAISANFPSVSGNGTPVGWAAGTFVGGVAIANAGTGYTNGTFNVASTYNIGSQSPAIASVTVSGGIIISASLVQAGGPFLAAPTFGLTELTGGSSASLLAQLYQSSAYVSSFDSTSVSATSLVKGIAYTPLTAAQITAGAWIVVQESGIANVLVTTASGTAASGNQVTVASGGAVTSNSTIAYSALEVGFTLAKPAAATVVPIKLTIPVVED